MRIWDIPPRYLCRKHLLAEHRELHGLWNILTIHNGQGGYSHHPETVRWFHKTAALFKRHERLVNEFLNRGYHHKTPLDKTLAQGIRDQNEFINTIAEQKIILKNKPCDCLLE
jgi:hypothetical protein